MYLNHCSSYFQDGLKILSKDHGKLIIQSTGKGPENHEELTDFNDNEVESILAAGSDLFFVSTHSQLYHWKTV